MIAESKSVNWPAKLLIGFIAGFLATLIFHQLALALFWSMNLVSFKPFSMAPTRPFGVPYVISLAFWGGVWGIVFALIQQHFRRGGIYWLASFLFGGIFPPLVALLIVLPLKGMPVGGGWNPALLIGAFIINAVWGVGTALFFKMLLFWKSR